MKRKEKLQGRRRSMKGVHQDSYRDDVMEADVVITKKKKKKDRTEANCN